jgi:hypothetical protein
LPGYGEQPRSLRPRSLPRDQAASWWPKRTVIWASGPVLAPSMRWSTCAFFSVSAPAWPQTAGSEHPSAPGVLSNPHYCVLCRGQRPLHPAGGTNGSPGPPPYGRSPSYADLTACLDARRWGDCHSGRCISSTTSGLPPAWGSSSPAIGRGEQGVRAERPNGRQVLFYRIVGVETNVGMRSDWQIPCTIDASNTDDYVAGNGPGQRD